MKTLTLILIALSFNATASERVSQPKLEARCYSWAVDSGLDESISNLHFDLASKVLSLEQLHRQVGFAEGFLLSYDKADTEASLRKSAYRLYANNCAKSI